MKKTRRRYDREFKISVVAELEGGKPPAQIAREHGIHPSLPSRWRDELAENPEKAFSGNGNKYKDQARIAELERLLGQAHAENELLVRRAKLMISSMVKIQPEERLASTSELNLASSLVTGCSEAKGMGYWAATQVKGLSPEIVVVSEVDVVKRTEDSTLIAVNPNLVSCNFDKSVWDIGEAMRARRGLRPWHGIKGIL
jgi:transposase